MMRMQAYAEWHRSSREDDKKGRDEFTQEEIDEGMARMKELSEKGPPIGTER